MIFNKIKTLQDFQKRLILIFSIIILVTLSILISNIAMAQVLITSSSGIYTQDFGNSDITSWTNNSTFTGWYSTPSSIIHQNITAVAPSNTGGFYSYECNGDNNQKIGSRPSNSVPGSVGTYIRYGVRFKNNSGQTITKIRITFTAYQFSLAENDNEVNTLEFHYRIASSITDLTSGTYTSVPSLWYEMPNNDTVGNSNQLLGYPCTVSSTFDQCINVTLNDGDEIMLRWSDKNDSNNDHHNGIDNVTIYFYPNSPENSSSCVSPLPITLLKFNTQKDKDKTLIEWITSSETNNDYFNVEHSIDGETFSTINTIKGAGNSNQILNYQCYHINPINGINYYRLKQVDFDGSFSYSEIKAVNFENNQDIAFYYNNQHIYLHTKYDIHNTGLQIFDLRGQLVFEEIINLNQNLTSIKIPSLSNGIYIAKVKNEEFQNSIKFVVSN